MKPKIKINTLKYLAIKYSESDIPEIEIRQKNITPAFYSYINKTINPKGTKKQLLKIQISSGVIEGKSTLGLELTRYVNEDLYKKPMQLHYYCPEQWNFGRKTIENNPDTNKPYENVCILVDEMDIMNETGVNATIEQRYLQQFNAVQAQRFIHTIACSADNRELDYNAKIVLNIEEMDEKNQTTTASVYYHLKTPNKELKQLIGIIIIDVKKTINSEWYKKYREKKFRKFTLMTKHGIFQPRQLHFAKVILTTYKKVEGFITTFKPPKDLIQGKAQRVLNQEKIPITIFALEHIKSEVNSLVIQKIAIEAIKKQMHKTKNRETLSELGYQKKQLEIELEEDIMKLQELITINTEYEGI